MKMIHGSDVLFSLPLNLFLPWNFRLWFWWWTFTQFVGYCASDMSLLINNLMHTKPYIQVDVTDARNNYNGNPRWVIIVIFHAAFNCRNRNSNTQSLLLLSFIFYNNGIIIRAQFRWLYKFYNELSICIELHIDKNFSRVCNIICSENVLHLF